MPRILSFPMLCLPLEFDMGQAKIRVRINLLDRVIYLDIMQSIDFLSFK